MAESGNHERGESGREFLQELVRAHGDALYRIARSLTGNPEDAQDLVQETFLRAWRYHQAFRPDGNPRAWLFKILHNLYIDGKRRENRGARTIPDESAKIQDFYLYRQALDSDQLRMAGDPEAIVLEGLLDEDIQQALDNLAEHYRTPFLLCTLEGLSYKEVAEILGVPVGTVMSRVHRARTILQQQLWDYFIARFPHYAPQGAEFPEVPPECADACRAISAYLDKELDPRTLRVVQGHLNACRRCCDQLVFERRLRAVIRERLRRQRLPRAFKHRLRKIVSLL